MRHSISANTKFVVTLHYYYLLVQAIPIRIFEIFVPCSEKHNMYIFIPYTRETIFITCQQNIHASK